MIKVSASFRPCTKTAEIVDAASGDQIGLCCRFEIMHLYSEFEYAQTLSNMGSPIKVSGVDVPLLSTVDQDGDYVTSVYPYSVFETRTAFMNTSIALASLMDTSGWIILEEGDSEWLRSGTPSVENLMRFKTHYGVNFERSWKNFATNHVRNIRRAEDVVDLCTLDIKRDFNDMYSVYHERMKKLQVPRTHQFLPVHLKSLGQRSQVLCIGGRQNGVLVAFQVWISHASNAYLHMSAANESGIKSRSLFLLTVESLAILSQRVRTANLGGNAGQLDNPSSGLARFKRGFANRLGASYAFKF